MPGPGGPPEVPPAADTISGSVAPVGRVAFADRRWLLPGALGLFVVGVLAGCVMGAQALRPVRAAEPPATPAAAADSGTEAPVVSASAVPPSSAPASPSASPEHRVPAAGRLQNAATSQCVAADRKEGAPARLGSCGSDGSQAWRLTTSGKEVYSVANQASGQCLDVAKRSKDDGAPVQTWGCNQGPNQQWTVRWQGPDTFALVSANSGKCVDIAGGVLQQRACRDVDTQFWRF